MDPQDIGMVLIQELWKKVAFGAQELVGETRDMMFEKGGFKEFSNNIAQLSIIFEALQAKKVDTKSLESTKASLESLCFQLKKARDVIKDYKSGSKLLFVLNSSSVLKQMEDLAKEIATAMSLLQLANMDTTLYIRSETDKVIDNLRSIEFSSRATSEAIASEIEKSMASHVRSRDETMTLLNKIAEAAGTSMNVSLVQNELALLKQEKEEMEAQKKQAEAFQLSQLIELLHSSEMDMCIMPEEELTEAYQQNSIDSFMCPLCHEVMTDPVAIVCGHSFERKAIQEYIGGGEISCPICKQELHSLELTPNISLRGSVEEWKQREIFHSALSGITSTDHEIMSKSLESLQHLMEIPCYRAIVSEKDPIPKLVECLQHKSTNTPAALKCLYHLSCYSDENKEILIKAGVLRYIVKCFYEGDADGNVFAILLELSTKNTFAERIGSTKDFIPLLVSMLHNNNHDVAQKAKMVLENLSSTTHFIIKMAEAGYFEPFISRFNEGTFETRAQMAATLENIQIGDNNIKSFEDTQFISKLLEMLSSSSPAWIMACLKCTKKLLLYPKMVKWFLADTTKIPHLIGLISHIGSETHCKLEATEVLTSLIKQLSDFQEYPDLQEVETPENVTHLMCLAITSEPQLKVKFLELLIVLTHKSKTVRDLVRSNNDAVKNLFGSLKSDPPRVRQLVMKLIYNVSEKHPAGVPLPPTPEKENAINALVTILSSSPDNIERSTAAGILGCLPTNDIVIDEILRRSEALKAIQEVLRTVDNDNAELKGPINPDDSLLENVLAALLHYTQPTKLELQREVCELELYPSLVLILSRGSSLAKEYAAIALAHLSQSSSISVHDTNSVSEESNNSGPLIQRQTFFPNIFWCCSASTTKKSICSIHGSSCSPRHTFCLVKADAVRPLVQTLRETQSGAAEAALTALNTMLKDNRTLSRAASVIVENQGVEAILEVLQRGTLSAKDEALDLFLKILENTEITNTQCQQAERILIHLLAEDALKKRAALVLRQMNILPEQSSYF